jgi:hypothetical protein
MGKLAVLVLYDRAGAEGEKPIEINSWRTKSEDY